MLRREITEAEDGSVTARGIFHLSNLPKLQVRHCTELSVPSCALPSMLADRVIAVYVAAKRLGRITGLIASLLLNRSHVRIASIFALCRAF